METNFKVDVPSFALGFNTGKSKGGVELNIAYGDTPPEDTSKLWVKTGEPSNTLVSSEVVKNPSLGDRVDITALPKTLPTALQGMGCAAVGTKAYLFGGYTGSNRKKDLLCFDTETKTIRTISVTGTVDTLMNTSGASVGTKVYFFGGQTTANMNKIWRLDTDTEEFVQLSETLPNVNSAMCAASVGDKIYLFGGAASNSNKVILCFDTTTEKIRAVTETLPTATQFASCAAVGNKVYLFGGYDGSNRLNQILCFDVDSEKIRTVTKKLPVAVRGMSAVEMNGNIYLFGGETSTGISDTMYRFNVDAETLDTLLDTLPQPLTFMCAVGIDSGIYLFGGLSNNATRVATIHYIVSADVLLADGIVQIIPHTTSNIFTIIRTGNAEMRIGVSAAYKGKPDGVGEEIEVALYKDGAWATV